MTTIIAHPNQLLASFVAFAKRRPPLAVGLVLGALAMASLIVYAVLSIVVIGLTLKALVVLIKTILD